MFSKMKTLALLSCVALSTSHVLPRSLYSSKILSRAEQVKDEYDYIIVGGGTSGLTVADRLTEDGKSKLDQLSTIDVELSSSMGTQLMVK